jgi:hypothetical protein
VTTSTSRPAGSPAAPAAVRSPSRAVASSLAAPSRSPPRPSAFPSPTPPQPPPLGAAETIDILHWCSDWGLGQGGRIVGSWGLWRRTGVRWGPAHACLLGRSGRIIPNPTVTTLRGRYQLNRLSTGETGNRITSYYEATGRCSPWKSGVPPSPLGTRRAGFKVARIRGQGGRPATGAPTALETFEARRKTSLPILPDPQFGASMGHGDDGLYMFADLLGAIAR